MSDAIWFVDSNSTEFILGLGVLTLMLLVYCIVLSRKVSGIVARRGHKAPDETAGEITDRLKEHSRAIGDLANGVDEVSSRLNDQACVLQRCLQRVGLVRFNAFDDVGGEQSFSLVLLDDDSNGVAISSIYGRQDSRLYVKAIISAEGERPLSDEERKALQNALAGRSVAAEVQRGQVV